MLVRRVGLFHLEAVEDAVQGALLAALTAWAASGIPDNPSAWLYRVAHNHLVGVLRKDQGRQRVLYGATDQGADNGEDPISPALVRQLAAAVVRVHSRFPVRAFVKQACAGIAELELLDRGRHIARALGTHLPELYPEAIEVLLRSLGPEHASEELVGAGLAPFFHLPHVLFVAERGLEHFDLSMRAQYELTKRFSAEFSIRSYIAREPERTFAVLREWARDENAHVRRLVSEGTRLRLLWASRSARSIRSF